MTLTYFADQTKFRKWLEKNHKKETELLVGFYKVGSGKASMTWPQSVDEALCFGWIDSIRRSVDEESYCIRFTPRKSTSIWSAININKVETMIKEGRMTAAGLEAFKKRKEERSRIYSFESATKELADSLEKNFKSNKKAWAFFTAQAPSYQKVAIHWIMSARQETTRLSRLDKMISGCENQKRLW